MSHCKSSFSVQPLDESQAKLDYFHKCESGRFLGLANPDADFATLTWFVFTHAGKTCRAAFNPANQVRVIDFGDHNIQDSGEAEQLLHGVTRSHVLYECRRLSSLNDPTYVMQTIAMVGALSADIYGDMPDDRNLFESISYLLACGFPISENFEVEIVNPVINNKDFLRQRKKYDLVILNHIFNAPDDEVRNYVGDQLQETFSAAVDGAAFDAFLHEDQPWLSDEMRAGIVKDAVEKKAIVPLSDNYQGLSPLHSQANWQKRLAGSDAKMVIALCGFYEVVDSYYLEAPPYAAVIHSADRHDPNYVNMAENPYLEAAGYLIHENYLSDLPETVNHKTQLALNSQILALPGPEKYFDFM